MTTLLDQAEETAKEAVLEQHEANYGQVLDELRARMKALYLVRLEQYGGRTAYVTADDARAVLGTVDRYQNMHFPSMNFLGNLYRTKEWQDTGKRYKSRTKGSHCNELKCWRWVGGAD